MVFWDHRGHGRSEWGPVEQCTQDQLVADMEGIRQALGLGPVYVLGISWGGFLGLMYAARHPAAIRMLAVVGASASHEFMPRAEANARQQATPEQWTAYQSLWDGSLADDASFRRAFETIRPLYFHDKALAAAANAARADTQYRLAVRKFVIEHEYPTYDCRAELARITCPTLVHGRAPRLDLPRRPGGGDPQADRALGARDLRGERPLAAGRGARDVHQAARLFPRRIAARGAGRRPAALARLEELDRIPGGVLDEDLGATRTSDDVVAEPQSRRPKAIHVRREVLDDQLNAVPAARLGLTPIGHGPAGRAGSAAEQEPQVATSDIGEGRAPPWRAG